MDRIYLMPMVDSGGIVGRAPKYIAQLTGLRWAAMDYGAHDWCMVRVLGITTEGHAGLTEQTDVVALPADLDQQIGAQRDQVENLLEARGIPAQWLSQTHTYRQALKVVAAIFQFSQRFNGLGFGKLLDGTVTLATRYNQLPLAVRTRLQQAAESFGWDTSALSGTSTVRQMLKAMADQWGLLEIHIGGETL